MSLVDALGLSSVEYIVINSYTNERFPRQEGSCGESARRKMPLLLAISSRGSYLDYTYLKDLPKKVVPQFE